MKLSSFGRSFLGCPSGLPTRLNCSPRFAVRAFAAARARWPEGHLEVDHEVGVARWMVNGSCGLFLRAYVPSSTTVH